MANVLIGGGAIVGLIILAIGIIGVILSRGKVLDSLPPTRAGPQRGVLTLRLISVGLLLIVLPIMILTVIVLKISAPIESIILSGSIFLKAFNHPGLIGVMIIVLFGVTGLMTNSAQVDNLYCIYNWHEYLKKLKFEMSYYLWGEFVAVLKANSALRSTYRNFFGTSAKQGIKKLWNDQVRRAKAVNNKQDAIALFNEIALKPSPQQSAIIDEVNNLICTDKEFNLQVPDVVLFVPRNPMDRHIDVDRVQETPDVSPLYEALGHSVRDGDGEQLSFILPNGEILNIVLLSMSLKGDLLRHTYIHELFHVQVLKSGLSSSMFITIPQDHEDVIQLLDEGLVEYFTQVFMDKYLGISSESIQTSYKVNLRLIREWAKDESIDNLLRFHQTGDTQILISSRPVEQLYALKELVHKVIGQTKLKDRKFIECLLMNVFHDLNAIHESRLYDYIFRTPCEDQIKAYERLVRLLSRAKILDRFPKIEFHEKAGTQETGTIFSRDIAQSNRPLSKDESQIVKRILIAKQLIINEAMGPGSHEEFLKEKEFIRQKWDLPADDPRKNILTNCRILPLPVELVDELIASLRNIGSDITITALNTSGQTQQGSLPIILLMPQLLAYPHLVMRAIVHEVEAISRNEQELTYNQIHTFALKAEESFEQSVLKKFHHQGKLERNTWDYLIDQDEGVIFYLLSLLLQEINRNKAVDDHKQLGDIRSNDLFINIPQIGFNLVGMGENYLRRTDRLSQKEAVNLMQHRLGIAHLRKTLKAYPSLEIMLQEIRVPRVNWRRVILNKEHVLYLLNLLLEQIKNTKAKNNKVLGDINSSDMKIKIIGIGKSLKPLLVRYAQQTKERTTKAGLALLKRDLGIEDTLTRSKQDPLAGLKSDWQAVVDLLKKFPRRESLNQENLLEQLISQSISPQEEHELIKQMKEQQNPAAREALIEPLMPQVRFMVNRFAKLNSDLGEVEDVITKIKIVLYRRIWRHDPSIKRFHSRALGQRKLSDRKAIVQGTVFDHLRDIRGSRRKSFKKIVVKTTEDLDLVRDKQDPKDFGEHIDLIKVKNLLDQIYIPKKKRRNKNRDILIYLWHYQGITLRETALKIRRIIGRLVSIANMSRVVNSVGKTLKSHLQKQDQYERLKSYQEDEIISDEEVIAGLIKLVKQENPLGLSLLHWPAKLYALLPAQRILLPLKIFIAVLGAWWETGVYFVWPIIKGKDLDDINSSFKYAHQDGVLMADGSVKEYGDYRQDVYQFTHLFSGPFKWWLISFPLALRAGLMVGIISPIVAFIAFKFHSPPMPIVFILTVGAASFLCLFPALKSAYLHSAYNTRGVLLGSANYPLAMTLTLKSQSIQRLIIVVAITLLMMGLIGSYIILAPVQIKDNFKWTLGINLSFEVMLAVGSFLLNILWMKKDSVSNRLKENITVRLLNWISKLTLLGSIFTVYYYYFIPQLEFIWLKFLVDSLLNVIIIYPLYLSAALKVLDPRIKTLNLKKEKIRYSFILLGIFMLVEYLAFISHRGESYLIINSCNLIFYLLVLKMAKKIYYQSKFYQPPTPKNIPLSVHIDKLAVNLLKKNCHILTHQEAKGPEIETSAVAKLYLKEIPSEEIIVLKNGCDIPLVTALRVLNNDFSNKIEIFVKKPEDITEFIIFANNKILKYSRKTQTTKGISYHAVMLKSLDKRLYENITFEKLVQFIPDNAKVGHQEDKPRPDEQDVCQAHAEEFFIMLIKSLNDFNDSHVNNEQLKKKIVKLFQCNHPNVDKVRAFLILKLQEMAQHIENSRKGEKSTRGQERARIVGIIGEIMGIYYYVFKEESILKGIPTETLKGINYKYRINDLSIKKVDSDIGKEIDLVTERMLFEFKFLLNWRHLYSQIVKSGWIGCSHFEFLLYPEAKHIQRIVYYGYEDNGYIVSAIKKYLLGNPFKVVGHLIVQQQGFRYELSLREFFDFLFSPEILQAVDEEASKRYKDFVNINWEEKQKEIFAKIQEMLRQLPQENLLITIAVEKIDKEDQQFLKRLIQSSSQLKIGVNSVQWFDEEVKRYMGFIAKIKERLNDKINNTKADGLEAVVQIAELYANDSDLKYPILSIDEVVRLLSYEQTSKSSAAYQLRQRTWLLEYKIRKPLRHLSDLEKGLKQYIRDFQAVKEHQGILGKRKVKGIDDLSRLEDWSNDFFIEIAKASVDFHFRQQEFFDLLFESFEQYEHKVQEEKDFTHRLKMMRFQYQLLLAALIINPLDHYLRRKLAFLSKRLGNNKEAKRILLGASNLSANNPLDVASVEIDLIRLIRNQMVIDLKHNRFSKAFELMEEALAIAREARASLGPFASQQVNGHLFNKANALASLAIIDLLMAEIYHLRTNAQGLRKIDTTLIELRYLYHAFSNAKQAIKLKSNSLKSVYTMRRVIIKMIDLLSSMNIENFDVDSLDEAKQLIKNLLEKKNLNGMEKLFKKEMEELEEEVKKIQESISLYLALIRRVDAIKVDIASENEFDEVAKFIEFLKENIIKIIDNQKYPLRVERILEKTPMDLLDLKTIYYYFQLEKEGHDFECIFAFIQFEEKLRALYGDNLRKEFIKRVESKAYKEMEITINLPEQSVNEKVESPISHTGTYSLKEIDYYLKSDRLKVESMSIVIVRLRRWDIFNELDTIEEDFNKLMKQIDGFATDVQKVLCQNKSQIGQTSSVLKNLTILREGNGSEGYIKLLQLLNKKIEPLTDRVSKRIKEELNKIEAYRDKILRYEAEFSFAWIRQIRIVVEKTIKDIQDIKDSHNINYLSFDKFSEYQQRIWKTETSLTYLIDNEKGLKEAKELIKEADILNKQLLQIKSDDMDEFRNIWVSLMEQYADLALSNNLTEQIDGFKKKVNEYKTRLSLYLQLKTNIVRLVSDFNQLMNNVTGIRDFKDEHIKKYRVLFNQMRMVRVTYDDFDETTNRLKDMQRRLVRLQGQIREELEDVCKANQEAIINGVITFEQFFNLFFDWIDKNLDKYQGPIKKKVAYFTMKQKIENFFCLWKKLLSRTSLENGTNEAIKKLENLLSYIMGEFEVVLNNLIKDQAFCFLNEINYKVVDRMLNHKIRDRVVISEPVLNHFSMPVSILINVFLKGRRILDSSMTEEYRKSMRNLVTEKENIFYPWLNWDSFGPMPLVELRLSIIHTLSTLFSLSRLHQSMMPGNVLSILQKFYYWEAETNKNNDEYKHYRKLMTPESIAQGWQTIVNAWNYIDPNNELSVLDKEQQEFLHRLIEPSQENKEMPTNRLLDAIVGVRIAYQNQLTDEDVLASAVVVGEDERAWYLISPNHAFVKEGEERGSLIQVFFTERVSSSNHLAPDPISVNVQLTGIVDQKLDLAIIRLDKDQLPKGIEIEKLQMGNRTDFIRGDALRLLRFNHQCSSIRGDRFFSIKEVLNTTVIGCNFSIKKELTSFEFQADTVKGHSGSAVVNFEGALIGVLIGGAGTARGEAIIAKDIRRFLETNGIPGVNLVKPDNCVNQSVCNAGFENLNQERQQEFQKQGHLEECDELGFNVERLSAFIAWIQDKSGLADHAFKAKPTQYRTKNDQHIWHLITYNEFQTLSPEEQSIYQDIHQIQNPQEVWLGANAEMISDFIDEEGAMRHMIGLVLFIFGSLGSLALAIFITLGIKYFGRELDGQKIQDLEEEEDAIASRYPFYDYPVVWNEANQKKIGHLIDEAGFLENSIIHSTGVKYVLLYPTDNDRWKLGAVIVIETVSSSRNIYFYRNPRTRLSRVPESFIQETLAHQAPHQIEIKTVNIADTQKKDDDLKIAFMKVFSRINVLFINHRLTSFESSDNLTEENRFTFTKEKMGLIQQAKYYFSSLRFSKIYRNNAIFVFIEHHISYVLNGLFLGIMFYMAQEHGVLAFYNVVSYIIPILVALIIMPFFSRWIVTWIKERRDLRSNEPQGSLWQRKIANTKVLTKFNKYIFIYGVFDLMIIVLMYLTIPSSYFQGHWSESWWISLSPGLFILAFILWDIIENTAGDFITQIMGEIDAGEIDYNKESVRRGFTSIASILDNIEGTLNNLIQITAISIGYGIFLMDWQDLMFPLLIIFGLASSLSWFGYGIFFGMDLDNYIDIDTDLILSEYGSGRLYVSENIRILFDERNDFRDATPHIIKPGITRLPWLRQMGVKLVYKQEPKIELKRTWFGLRYWSIKGQSKDPEIRVYRHKRHVGPLKTKQKKESFVIYFQPSNCVDQYLKANRKRNLNAKRHEAFDKSGDRIYIEGLGYYVERVSALISWMQKQSDLDQGLKLYVTKTKHVTSEAQPIWHLITPQEYESLSPEERSKYIDINQITDPANAWLGASEKVFINKGIKFFTYLLLGSILIILQLKLLTELLDSLIDTRVRNFYIWLDDLLLRLIR